MNVPPGNKIQSLLTDGNGIHREFSVPQGTVKDEYIQQQKEVAQTNLPAVFKDLVISTNEPFIQTIFDLSVHNMAFGRVCIVGDAAFVPRPHTAASASKSATNAMALANSIVTYNRDLIEILLKF